jgi:hypothetical protein
MKNWLGGSGTIAGVSSGDFPVAWLFVTTSSANDTRFAFHDFIYHQQYSTAYRLDRHTTFMYSEKPSG